MDLSNPPEGVSPEMDNASIENMRGLAGLGKEAADEHRAELKKFMGLLLADGGE